MSKKDRDNWVQDTQMFQRISGVKVMSKEELEKAWDEDHKQKPRKQH